jgi:hypothetical protein
LDEFTKVIMHQIKLRMDIPEGIKVVVQVWKVLDFDYVKTNFDEDKELNKSLELFGSLLIIDGKQMVVVIC